MFEHFLSLIRREVERTHQKLNKRPRQGLVEHYDPDKHAVKVRLQPEGTLTGWLPLTTLAIGNQFGVAYAPNIKDQVEIHFEGGDQQSARVMTRHYSKADKAPRLEAGEYAQIHSSGSIIKHSKDGTVRIAGAGDVDVGKTGGGHSGNTGTGGEGNSAGDNSPPADQQQPSKTKAKNWIQLNPDGTINIEADSGDITLKSANIILDGQVFMGGSKAAVQAANRPVSAKGTVDTNGDSDIGNPLTKVWGL